MSLAVAAQQFNQPLMIPARSCSIWDGCVEWLWACTDLGTKPGSYTIRVMGTSRASVVTAKVRVTVTTE